MGQDGGGHRFLYSSILRGNGHATLLDISSGWQRVAKKQLRCFSNLRFKKADIFSAGIEDGSFDIIALHFMLHDIGQSERRAIVFELVMKLKPCGYINFGEPTITLHGMSADGFRI